VLEMVDPLLMFMASVDNYMMMAGAVSFSVLCVAYHQNTYMPFTI